ncbi:hypothetical protein [Xylella fastidiosa]|uniref:hypothetical protein n=1 Tax=Xylella fastidiosa TaxID=2371 RepID=UPI003984BDF9
MSDDTNTARSALRPVTPPTDDASGAGKTAATTDAGAQQRSRPAPRRGRTGQAEEKKKQGRPHRE